MEATSRLIEYSKVFDLLDASDKRIVSLRGGTRSGKTYNTLIWWIWKLKQETGKTLTIARNTMPALKASAMRDFFSILNSLGLYSEANHNKTSNEYTFNNNLIEFIAVNQAERVRGRKRNYLFLNEANETDLESFRQLAFRTTEKIVLDYNPSEAFSWIYDDVETRDDCDLFVTTYQDNEFLEDSLIQEIERLKDADEDYWNIYGLGLIGSGGSRIFTHWRETDYIPAGEKVYGLDFGYNNPTALAEVTMADNTLYWREMLYESKLTNADLIQRLKLFPELIGRLIIADAAEPQRIEEIRRAGFRIQPAFKIVKDTVDFVKSKLLRIDSGSSNLLREIKRYSWKTDKAGNLTDEVVKFDDHCFIAGTLVTTDNGDKPIESIQNGDLVLTRKGFRQVLSAGITKPNAEVMTIELANGKTLTGTANHPIWVEGKGFTTVDAVRYNDYLLESKSLWKSLNLNQPKQSSALDSIELFTGVTPKQKNHLTGNISDAALATSKKTLIHYIEMYGVISTAISQAVITFTTKTEIPQIITSLILNAFRRPNILAATLTSDVFAPHHLSNYNILTASENSQRNGINLTKAERGTLNTQNERLPLESQSKKFANFAIKSLKRLIVQKTINSAQTNANRRIEETSVLIMSKEFAGNAETPLKLTSIAKQNTVQLNAERNGARVVGVKKELKKQTVFNLAVDEVPEYFANGFLVHNCADAARYASFYFNIPVKQPARFYSI